MQATSSSQYDSTVKDTVPDLERVRDGIWAMPMPMPYGTVPYSLTYLIRDTAGGVHVIDPGFNSVDNWGALAFTMQRIGHSMTDVASITLTHLHGDHTGMATRLRKSSGGAPIVMHRDEQSALDTITATGHPQPDLDAFGIPAERRTELAAVTRAAVDYPDFQADVLVDDGDALAVPGRDLRVLHTPGHTTGSICVREVGEQLLFTGDHILPSVHPGLGLGGPSAASPIAEYLDSLDKVSQFDDHEVCPGHGYRFTGLAQRADRIATHHRNRTTEVSRVLLNRPNATVWEIASQLTWTGGWANLHGYYVYTALVQTAMHVEYLKSR